jgi:single-stranded-DNA-specific exonuclease
MAAGLQISRDSIREFEERFEQSVAEADPGDRRSKPILIDCALDFDDITDALIDEIERLNPFGEGNPEPLFMAADVRVTDMRIVGRYHRQMTLSQSRMPRKKGLGAIQFNVDPAERPDRFDKIAYRLRWNRWNGKKTPQILIEET